MLYIKRRCSFFQPDCNAPQHTGRTPSSSKEKKLQVQVQAVVVQLATHTVAPLLHQPHTDIINEKGFITQKYNFHYCALVSISSAGALT